MYVILIQIEQAKFILPEANPCDDYEFPTFITENIELLREFIQQGKQAMADFAKEPLKDHFKDLPNVQYFKDRTGIIGAPFDMQDTEMYLLTHPEVEVVMEMSFDD